MNQRIGIVATALAVAVLAGCGIQPETSPTPIDRPFRPAASSTATPPPTGTLSEKLYLIEDGTLVPVTRHVGRTPTVEQLLADLRSAPNDTERESGLTNALLGTNTVTSVRMSGAQAVIELAAPVDGTARTDDQLAYAQLVCTLTSLPGVETVQFTHDGRPIGVPRGDGSVSTAPLSVEDYAAMIASR
ncbi:hypothetical protein GCM10009682_27050 [Luedemannella flava]|uniref:GerMN domain-containing protein n=1 Tax=Luedemannella flava TaxID=349316 RepID=A0ABN2LZQ7_9ACTN